MENKALSNSENLEDKENKQSQRESLLNKLINFYEKKNAFLERKHNELAERVRIMELALPSVLSGFVVDDTNNFTMTKENITS
ncbi:hypothetical protein PV325_002426 [Microctonus aethiopoides]|uniref:Uncharacterized protein n=1 Tax=Microctonus aethiopoides TaxID=144406 RepID=A0AA39KKW5_9HYME|nr:hypothetical protein PV325_002426 [Microctonus aethiopoides]KAK0091452.1 hypothetical protein PV326_003212 [Microctonus aethiopoides]KAK0165250.1 hypothetical protein PV328_003783 [Microctonus aethiopoides]